MKIRQLQELLDGAGKFTIASKYMTYYFRVRITIETTEIRSPKEKPQS
jgi:hypothetical protein